MKGLIDEKYLVKKINKLDDSYFHYDTQNHALTGRVEYKNYKDFNFNHDYFLINSLNEGERIVREKT